jgi:hypothetical protein
MRSAITSATLRHLHYYTVPTAGGMVGMGRTQSYDAARAGQIPTERDGKFLLVPRRPWDRQVRRLLKRPRKAAAENA